MSLHKRLVIQGKEQSFQALQAGTQIWIHFEGQTWDFSVFTEKDLKKKLGAQGAQTGAIVSPMPGKIIKILKEAGQQVHKGEIIVVMEAMKMEYSLRSEVSGLMETLNCAVNDQVSLGQVLAKVIPPAKDEVSQ